MAFYNSVASAIARTGGLLLEVVARVPFALWLGARSRTGSDCVFIHIDEWGRITRLRGPRERELS